MKTFTQKLLATFLSLAFALVGLNIVNVHAQVAIEADPNAIFTLGDTNKNLNWWTVFSEGYELNEYEQLTFKINNYSKAEQRWQNFAFVFSDSQHAEGSMPPNHGMMRADAFADTWPEIGVIGHDKFETSFQTIEEFFDVMRQAQATVVLTRKNGAIDVDSKYIGANGNIVTIKGSLPLDPNLPRFVSLTGENAYIELLSVTKTQLAKSDIEVSAESEIQNIKAISDSNSDADLRIKVNASSPSLDYGNLKTEAYEISIVNPNGDPVEPSGNVRITMNLEMYSNDTLALSQEINGNKENIALASVNSQEVSFDYSSAGKYVFSLDPRAITADPNAIATLGDVNYNLPWWRETSFTQSYDIRVGDTLTFKLNNYSKGDNNRQNLSFVFSEKYNDVYRYPGNSGVLRAYGQADSIPGVVGNLPESEFTRDFEPTSQRYIDVMKDADVTVKMARTETGIDVDAVYAGANGDTLNMQVTIPVAKEDIRQVLVTGFEAYIELLSVEREYGNWQVPENAIKVLSIGNSFSEDAHRYLNEISMAENRPIATFNAYKGGQSLNGHRINLDTNAWEYTLIVDGKDWAYLNSINLREALSLMDYDVITVQQVSGWSGLIDFQQAHLDSILPVIKELQGNAKLYYHETWAYDEDSTHPDFARYDNDMTKMHEGIVNASETIAGDNDLELIEVGQVIDKLRASEYFSSNSDDTLPTLTRDGFHLNDIGRYAAALTWYATLTREQVSDSTYLPEGLNISEEVLDFIKATVDETVLSADLSFDPSGGTINGSTDPVIIKALEGDTITIIPAPDRENYRFLYWKGSEYQAGDIYKVTGDHSFIAVWEAIDPLANQKADAKDKLVNMMNEGLFSEAELNEFATEVDSATSLDAIEEILANAAAMANKPTEATETSSDNTDTTKSTSSETENTETETEITELTETESSKTEANSEHTEESTEETTESTLSETSENSISETEKDSDLSKTSEHAITIVIALTSIILAGALILLKRKIRLEM